LCGQLNQLLQIEVPKSGIGINLTSSYVVNKIRELLTIIKNDVQKAVTIKQL